MDKIPFKVWEIEAIIDYKNCSVTEAIDTTTRYKGYTPGSAYRTGWLDGLRSAAKETGRAHDAAVRTITEASDTGKSKSD